MATRFQNEILKEYGESRTAETRGPLHPHRQIQYRSRVHTLRENLDLIIFFGAVVGCYSFVVLYVIIVLLSGAL